MYLTITNIIVICLLELLLLFLVFKLLGIGKTLINFKKLSYSVIIGMSVAMIVLSLINPIKQ